MEATAMPKAGGRVFYGWWIVLAGGLLTVFGSGTYFYGFSIFFKPMLDEFGWGRAATAGAFSLSRLEGGLEGPVAGWLIDKFGPRKMVLLGVAVFGAGFVLLYWVDSILTFYLVYGLLLSLGYNTGLSHALLAAVSNWFIRLRARAMSGIATAAGIGGTLFVPVIAWMVDTYGWRTSALIIGITIWAVGIPLAAVFRRFPEQYGLRPDGDPPDGQSEGSALVGKDGRLVSKGDADFSAREALVTSAFWVYAFAWALRAFVTSSVIVHVVTFLIDFGIDELVAAGVLSMMTLCSIPSRMLFGWLGDIYDKRRLLAVMSIGQAVGVLFLASAGISGIWVLGVPLEIALFIVVYGFSYGAPPPLLPALRADFFGRKAYATISGLMSPLQMIGTVAGPVFAGYVYDATQSYTIAFTVFAATFMLACASYIVMKPPRKRLALDSLQK